MKDIILALLLMLAFVGCEKVENTGQWYCRADLECTDYPNDTWFRCFRPDLEFDNEIEASLYANGACEDTFAGWHDCACLNTLCSYVDRCN